MRGIALLTLGAATFIAACAAAIDEPGTVSTFTPTFIGADAPDMAAKVAHGERVADVVGCTSCHGVDLQGGSYADDPDEGFVFAANLTRSIPRITDEEFKRLMREGVHPRRERLYYMPAKNLQRMSEADLDALLLFLRSLEPEGREWPLPTGGEVTDRLVELGILDTSASEVAEFRDNPPPDLGPSFALGRYVAAVTCAECHGPDLRGGNIYAPSFADVDDYTDDELRRLLTDGVKRNGDAHGLMALVAARNLSALTDEERAAISAYVRALAASE